MGAERREETFGDLWDVMRGDHEPETRHSESDGCSCLATQHNKGEGRTQQSSAIRHSRNEGIEGSSARKSPKIGNLLVAVFRVGKKIQLISNFEFLAWP